MALIRIEPSDLNFPAAELPPLRDQRADGHQVEVADRSEQGYGVTWWEVFHFLIEEVADPSPQRSTAQMVRSCVGQSHGGSTDVLTSRETPPAPNLGTGFGTDLSASERTQ